MLETDKHAYAISEMSVTAPVSRILNIATNLEKKSLLGVCTHLLKISLKTSPT